MRFGRRVGGTARLIRGFVAGVANWGEKDGELRQQERQLQSIKCHWRMDKPDSNPSIHPSVGKIFRKVGEGRLMLEINRISGIVVQG